MGYQYKGVCYPSRDLVRHEFCAAPRESVTSGGSLVSHSCVQPVDYAASAAPMSVTTNGSVTASYSLAWPSDIACEFDGSMATNSEAFGLILGFLVVVWCAKRLADFFWPKNHEL